MKSKLHDIINDILFAESQDGVKQICNRAFSDLEAIHLVPTSVHDFAGSVIKELDLFSPMDKTAQQWSNIKLAKICLRQYRRDHQSAHGR